MRKSGIYFSLLLSSAEASRASGCPLGRKKPGGSPNPLLYKPRRYLFGKQKTKSNTINSVNTVRKERDYSQSNAGADDLDGLSD